MLCLFLKKNNKITKVRTTLIKDCTRRSEKQGSIDFKTPHKYKNRRGLQKKICLLRHSKILT